LGALNNVFKTDHRVVTILLQLEGLTEINGVLADSRYHRVYGPAFAEAVKQNRNPYLDPNEVLRLLRMARGASDEVVRALVFHPRTACEEAFISACSLSEWEYAAKLVTTINDDFAQRHFQHAVQRGLAKEVEMLLLRVDPSAHDNKALLVAVENEDERIVKLLLKDGRVTVTGSAFGAAITNDPMVRMLMRAGHMRSIQVNWSTKPKIIKVKE
jgi:hypothetical protein